MIKYSDSIHTVRYYELKIEKPMKTQRRLIQFCTYILQEILRENIDYKNIDKLHL